MIFANKSAPSISKSKYGNTPEVIYEGSSYDPNTTNMAGLRWLPLESNPDVSNVCLNAVAWQCSYQ